MWFQRTIEFLNDLVWSYGVPVGDGQMIPWVVILLLGTGFYLTFQLGFIQFRKLAHGFRVTSGVYDNPDDPGDVPHFQALTTALSATVGIGNIAGVALAIHFGGPGALFWMWVTAFVGMATKYSEVTLAQFYRDVREETADLKSWMGSVSGGPMYYIEKGLGKSWKPAAIFFAIMLIATSFLTGNAVQANTVADTMRAEFGIEPWITGVIVAAVIALVILGGITRIGKVTGIVAPMMAGIYVLGALTILALNYDQLIPTFASVFTEAFNPSAGVAGTGTGVFLLTLMYGVRRGLFSNEAGQGSAPIAHSAAKTNEPSSEGVVALLEPFIDTIIICTLTAMVILVTGVWGDPVPTEFDLNSGNITYRVQSEGGLFADVETPEEIRIEDGVQRVTEGEPAMAWNQAVVERLFTECEGDCTEDGDLSEPFTGTLYPDEGQAIAQDGTTYSSLYGGGVRNGAPLTQLAFERGLAPLGDWGGYIVILSVLLFAVSTAISWSYYGDRCAHYLFGDRAVLPYKFIFVIMNFVGAITALTTIWTIGDIALGLVVVPNLIALIALSGKLKELTNSYFERKPWENGGDSFVNVIDEDDR
jgi:AGCS family alanine or glycine:cation symporter